MKKSRKPNGKNIDIALELLELSLFLKKSNEETSSTAKTNISAD